MKEIQEAQVGVGGDGTWCSMDEYLHRGVSHPLKLSMKNDAGKLYDKGF